VDQNAGPVLVTVEYHVAPEHREAFLEALVALARQRRRDGGYNWNVFEDTERPERIIETWLSDTWLDHLRQHRRFTRADRAIEQRVQQLAREPIRVTHYIAARPQHRAD
jgi:quinol monooxygenase YgiN